MPRPRPPCGTYNGYHAHARRDEEICGPCDEARREYHREYYRATTKIRKPERHYVDAEPVREAILGALDRGVTLAQIEHETGHSTNGLRKIRDGEVRRCRRVTRDKILAACQSLDPVPRRGHQPIQVTSLRLRALNGMGATWEWLAEQLQTSPSQVDRILHERHRTVSDEFAGRVERLMVAVGQGDARAPGMVDRGQPCLAGCGRRVDYGTCTRCRKRAQRSRERDRAA